MTGRSGPVKGGRAELEEKTMQYLYAADKDRVFMDTSSYEQMSMSEKQLGDSISYLKEEHGNKDPLPQGRGDQYRGPPCSWN